MVSKGIVSKKSIIAVAVVLIVTAVILAIYTFFDAPLYLMTPMNGDNDQVQLANPMDVLSQRLIIPETAEGLAGIKLEVETYGRINEGKLLVTLYEDDAPLYEWERKTVDLTNKQQIIFRTQNELPIDHNKQYSVSIQDSYEKPGNDVIIVMSTTSAPPGNTFLNGSVIEGKELFYSLICSRKYGVQRAILSAFIFISVLIVTMVILSMGIGQEGYRIKKLIWYTSAIIVMIASILLCDSLDGNTITDWAYYTLEAVRYGEWRNLALYLNENNLPTNYGILGTFINALSVLPLYIYVQHTGAEYNVVDFNAFRGISVIICVIITAFFIKKLVMKLGFAEEIADISAVLYMASPIVVWGNLCHGQIDPFCILFMVIAAYFIVCENMPLAVLFVMISAEFKQFSLIFAAIPMFILLLGKTDLKGYLKCIGFGLIPPVISRILSTVVFTNYASSGKIAEQAYMHILSIFETVVGTNALFFVLYVLIFFWCIFRVIKKEVKTADFLLVPMVIMFAFQIVVPQHMQWFIYPLIAIIIATLYLTDKRMGLVIYTMFSLLFIGFAMSYITMQTDNGMVAQGLMADRMGLETHIVSAAAIFNKVLPQASMWTVNSAMYGGLTACSIALFYEYRKSLRSQTVIDKITYCEGRYHYIAILGALLVSIGTMLFSMMLYFGLIWI